MPEERPNPITFQGAERGRSYGVVHLGSRTHYQVSAALAERSKLDTLYTDFYSPDWLTNIGHRLPRGLGSHLGRRHTDAVASRSVRSLSPLRSIAIRAVSRLSREYEPYVAGMDWELGRVAGAVAAMKDCGWVVYSLYWPGFLSTAPVRSPRSSPSILFKEHPTPSQIITILREHRERLGDQAAPDPEELMSPGSVARYEASLDRADAIVVPCSFVKRGLIELGIAESAISVIPLGSDRGGLTPVVAARMPRSSERIRLLWVGRPLFRKGFQDLLTAYSCLPHGIAELTIVLPARETKLPVDVLPEGARVLARLTTAELADEFASHDLFVMPSLVEGFGMVYLEALTFGTPIICTPNTGAADLINHGREGFIVEPGDPAAIAACILRVADDRDGLMEMRVAAKARATEWTWSRFRAGLVDAVESREL